jgi:hypothetical protein
MRRKASKSKKSSVKFTKENKPLEKPSKNGHFTLQNTITPFKA